MPSTVLVPTTLSALDGHHIRFGPGIGPLVLSDNNVASGYHASGEVNDTYPPVSPYMSFFNTQGLPVSATAPFSNPNVFGLVNVTVGLPVGDYNEAVVGIRNNTNISYWNRWNHDGGADTFNSNGTWAAARFGGAVVGVLNTIAQVNAVEVMMYTARNISGGDGGRDIVEAYWRIDHAAYKGGFVAMILELLGPLVAVGLHEMPRLTRELFRRSLTLYRPDEYGRAWRELRDYRAPRYFALGR